MCDNLCGLHMLAFTHDVLAKRVPPSTLCKNSGAIMLNDAPEFCCRFMLLSAP